MTFSNADTNQLSVKLSGIESGVFEAEYEELFHLAVVS